MIVTLDDGTKKDLHYSVVAKLKKQGKISVGEEPTGVLTEQKKRGRKPVN